MNIRLTSIGEEEHLQRAEGDRPGQHVAQVEVVQVKVLGEDLLERLGVDRGLVLDLCGVGDAVERRGEAERVAAVGRLL
eukprot:CAMPEP_0179976076 /NCGR_PEP_ID=MMETSP0983-20121128/39139_1 /TAXON_ID=483367 /ORGANISM="non described non described, Strain CCMP 2436" /LENGTH=78 /DNA_ID=CAMNT_0021892785 /DNA_START=176 /DNA_END=413 /DNA_ORIENTATION=-